MASVDVHNISISSFPSSLSLAATTSVVISKLRVCVCVFVRVCMFVCWFVGSFVRFVCLFVYLFFVCACTMRKCHLRYVASTAKTEAADRTGHAGAGRREVSHAESPGKFRLLDLQDMATGVSRSGAGR